ncbi:MAG: NAD-dependent epimerase/dehydratase family protein [Mycobacterium sp.]
MRVAVTGASGDFGSSIVRELLDRDYEVVGLSRRPHSIPSPGYTHACVDVRDADALSDATRGADAIVHLAWTTHPSHDAAATRAVDIGGTEAILRAVQRNSIGRLVTASSVMAYGARPDNPAAFVEADPLRPSPKHAYSQHKAEAEALIAASGANALMVRASSVMGRTTAGASAEGFSAPVVMGVKGARNEMQFIHPDDLARFFAGAVTRTDWTGPVNLAAPGVLSMAEVASILGKRYVELPAKASEAALTFLWNRQWLALDPGAIEALAYFPIVDLTKLSEDFGFHAAWTSHECVEDFARSHTDHVVLGVRKVDIPWRWPWSGVPEPVAQTPERGPAAPGGVAGEFDTTVHSDWNVFTAANTSEAFPGPMTPLSLELGLDSMRAGGVQSAKVLQVGDEMRRALSEDDVGAFGHGVYANLSVVFAMGSMMPGGGVEAWQTTLFGEDDAHASVETEQIGPWGMARRLPGIAAKLAAFGTHVGQIDAEARAAQKDWASYATLTDDQLIAQLYRCADEVANAWSAATQGSAYLVPLMGLIGKQGGERFATRIRIGDELVSAGMTRGVHRLAALGCRDPELSHVLHDSNPPSALRWIREQRPRFAAELDWLIAEYGHRGPRETELANSVFADAPERIVDAVAKLLNSVDRTPASDEEPLSRRLRALAALAGRFQRTREQVRDAAMRRTHQYRILAREVGARLAARGVIASPDDVFYLVRKELKYPPSDARSIVERRRAERKRLESRRPPINFVGHWDAVSAEPVELQPGELLRGTPVSAGVTKGTVRVLTVDSMDDLEPGEVLVTAFTDTGWTPFFSYAAAVVVDTGGEMSHAAVVAREFGVPCVVGTMTGSRALRTGHVVEVDGSAGTITRVK